MQKKPTVALALFEAIDVDAEDFHAGLNFAAVFRLPVIFLCVNDGKRAPLATSETIAVRGLEYRIAGVRVDGSDFLAIAAAVRAAAERARKGGGATLIEAVLGESDPIARLGAWLAGEKVLDAAAEASLRREVDAEVRAAVTAEEATGYPAARTIVENVLARPSAALAEQLAELERSRAARGQ
jgi:2-oxoisovalerate dehydrogenase E1 component alpha subunit